MKNGIALHALALATGALVALTAHAHDDEGHAKRHPADAAKVESTDFGQEGNPRKVTRTIQVGMADTMRFTPAAIVVRRGETIRFVVRNDGKVMHEMVLGTDKAIAEHAAMMRSHPGMAHADASMAHVKAGGSGEIVWQFTRAGDFRFACLQPGHFEAGMTGSITVK
jgi:uncharacterized cupredoxin-like copper-binding protein